MFYLHLNMKYDKTHVYFNFNVRFLNLAKFISIYILHNIYIVWPV